MGYIYCLIGKSGTGKDTVMEQILADKKLDIEKIVPYTTRPKRENEIDGVNYHYVSETEMLQMEENNLIVEKRSYNTVHGVWNYFTADNDIDYDRDYIIITTQEAIEKFISHFGMEKIYIVYLFLDDKTRLERCINRESMQQTPNYKEVCRRFLGDEEGFDEAKLKSFDNCIFVDTLPPTEECVTHIKNVIQKNRGDR